MFGFDLNKTQVWVAMALLLLCFAICPHWCHPHAGEDEDPDNEKDYESAPGDEEVEDSGEDTDVENAPPSPPTNCVLHNQPCVKTGPKKCCDAPAFDCVSPDLKVTKETFCLDMATLTKVMAAFGSAATKT